jgi:hypothetical protein
MTLAKVFGATTAYLLIGATMFSLLEPEGLGWTLATAGAGLVAGTAALLFVRRACPRGFTTVFGRNDGTSGS